MAKRKKKDFKSIAMIVAFGLIMVVSLVGLVKAYNLPGNIVIENVENFVVESGDQLAGLMGGTTNYDELDVTDGYKVDGTTVIDGSGNIDAPITSTTGSFSSYLDANGGFTQGAGVNAIATSTGTTVLTEDDLLDYSMIEVTVNTGSTATLTLPATSTLTSLIPNAGDFRSWLIHNATSTTMALTIGAGTGMDLIGVTSNDDVIDETEYSELDCYRQSDTDVTCKISELLHVD